MPMPRLFTGVWVISLPSTTMDAGGGVHQAGNHPEGGGLAAAGRAEERHQVPLLHFHVQAVDGGFQTCCVSFGQINDRQF